MLLGYFSFSAFRSIPAAPFVPVVNDALWRVVNGFRRQYSIDSSFISREKQFDSKVKNVSTRLEAIRIVSSGSPEGTVSFSNGMNSVDVSVLLQSNRSLSHQLETASSIHNHKMDSLSTEIESLKEEVRSLREDEKGVFVKTELNEFERNLKVTKHVYTPPHGLRSIDAILSVYVRGYDQIPLPLNDWPPAITKSIKMKHFCSQLRRIVQLYDYDLRMKNGRNRYFETDGKPLTMNQIYERLVRKANESEDNEKPLTT